MFWERVSRAGVGLIGEKNLDVVFGESGKKGEKRTKMRRERVTEEAHHWRRVNHLGSYSLISLPLFHGWSNLGNLKPNPIVASTIYSSWLIYFASHTHDVTIYFNPNVWQLVLNRMKQTTGTAVIILIVVSTWCTIIVLWEVPSNSLGVLFSVSSRGYYFTPASLLHFETRFI